MGDQNTEDFLINCKGEREIIEKNHHKLSEEIEDCFHWSAGDTDLFYKAMCYFGTDFNLIAKLFPGRNKKQVRAKYLREWLMNPRTISKLITDTFDAKQYSMIVETLVKNNKRE